MLGPNWSAISDILKLRYKEASEPERWRMLTRFFAGLPYGWGKENLRSADCSGTICAVLYIMGYDSVMFHNFTWSSNTVNMDLPFTFSIWSECGVVTTGTTNFGHCSNTFGFI